MSTEATKPADWKTYDQFALGIATNRLPATDALTGQTLRLALPDFQLTLQPRSQHALDWQERYPRVSGSVVELSTADDRLWRLSPDGAQGQIAGPSVPDALLAATTIRCRLTCGRQPHGLLRPPALPHGFAVG